MLMWKIYATLTLAMFVWGFNLPLLKYLLLYVGPVTMTAFRLLLAGAVVFIILAALKLIRLPTKKEWPYILGGALLNVVSHHYFLNMGLERTSGSNASLILGTGPVLTAISVSLIFRNYPSNMQWIGFILGLGGVSSVVLAGGGMAGLAVGDVFVFISIATQVLSFLIIAKAAKTLDPRLMTAYMMVIGSLLLIVISLIQEPGEIRTFLEVPTNFWLAFAASAVIGTAVGHLLYNYSVGEVGPSKAAIFINFNTMFALLGSVLFLGEVLTARHLIGFVLIIAGVVLGSGAAEELWKQRRSKTSS
ncbi:DMT family transporter [Sporosarcina pasteurii]|nr:DMT family transporter [Sporosarcina pasteurii]QBQ06225.1 DMT family transporter [Sporosarcina pasteurii]